MRSTVNDFSSFIDSCLLFSLHDLGNTYVTLIMYDFSINTHGSNHALFYLGSGAGAHVCLCGDNGLQSNEPPNMDLNLTRFFKQCSHRSTN